MKYFSIAFLSYLIVLGSCSDTYKGPSPKELTCSEYPSNDNVELLNGIVKAEDTTYYISNYVNETTNTKFYPCALGAGYKTDGFPIQYSGYLRKKEGDKKQYIELTATQPILNESIITNYYGFVRNRDSSAININERTGVIKNSKIENNKLKLLIAYNGCIQGRKTFITIYKTTQISGETKSYGFITSPYEACPTEFTLWYDIDVSNYKKSTLVIYDGIKTHNFIIPE